jgi:hypothetical protein
MNFRMQASEIHEIRWFRKGVRGGFYPVVVLITKPAC